MNFLKKLYRLLFVWNIPVASDEEMWTADAIVTQSCGRAKDGSPYEGNHQTMAEVARKLQEKYGLPLLVQEELKLVDPELRVVSVAGDPSRTGFSNSSWNTYEVAKIQVEYCRKKSWKKVIVIAGPDHVGRAIWTYQKLGLETLPALMPRGGGYIGANHQQWLFRTALGFRIREMTCRFLFWYWGYI